MKYFRKRKAVTSVLQPPPAVEAAEAPIQGTHLINLAIEAWRLGERCKRLASTSGKQDALVLFSVDSVFQCLKEIGFGIRDPAGERFNEGMSLDVLAFDYSEEERPESRVIQETVSPAVYFNGKLIKLAQVIVGKGQV